MKRIFITCCWLACLLLAASPLASADSLTDARLLKAAYLYNFAKLTVWPEDSFSEPKLPFILCITGKDELVENIKQLSGKTIHGHPVSIRTLQNGQSPANCHLLYIATSDRQNFPDIIKSVTNLPVLTVSELPYFAYEGGIIELYSDVNRTRFLINPTVALKQGLQISSRLLNMSIVIDGREKP